jgi:CrcB protein
MTRLDWTSVALLGGLGAVLRHLIAGWTGRRFETRFPLGTFVINISGAFALGVLTGAQVGAGAIFVAGGGLIGSFTTFSTWMFETQRLAEDGEVALAGWNIAASVAAGTMAAIAGWGLGALL